MRLWPATATSVVSAWPNGRARCENLWPGIGCAAMDGSRTRSATHSCPRILDRHDPSPPAPIPPEELTFLALAVVVDDRFPHLATIDGDQRRLRPVSPVKTDGFTVYVADLRAYHKTAEIAANPRVKLCYLDDGYNQVRITGQADVVNDRGLLQEIRDANPLLQQYLGSLDNLRLIMYRIRPNRVRYIREWALNYHKVPLTGSA